MDDDNSSIQPKLTVSLKKATKKLFSVSKLSSNTVRSQCFHRDDEQEIDCDTRHSGKLASLRIDHVDNKREEWDKKIDFLFSIIGFAVDLANVWRFPYLCYKNGGGVFLIPYTLMLLFGALPLFILELSLGQFAKTGPINVWDKMYPAAKGVGYCAVLISWHKLLQIDASSGFSDLGALRPEMVGCVFLTFILLYFSLFKGVKSSGKVVWVTATAPYVILTILLLRGVFLPGAGMGISYYLSPRLEKLRHPGVWTDAAVQVFYSIGVGFGVHLTYASFNKFNNNCYRDALLTACINSCTSFYSGFVIFIYLGYMAQGLQADISTVAKEGYGLVFQVYPEAISTLPLAKFWSILFFVMLVTLGLDSAMGGLEAVITGIIDEWKIKSISREVLTALVLTTSFLVSLINCTQGAGYTMVWFDSYAAAVSLLCSALFEALAIVYGYGIDRFMFDIESMLGFRPSAFWLICWKYISPLFLVTIIILSVTRPEPIVFLNYIFPYEANVLGWVFGLSSVFPIPLFGLFYLLKNCLFKRHEIGSREVSDREVIACV